MNENHPEEYHFTKMRQLVKEVVGDRRFTFVLDVGNGDGYLASFFQDCSDIIIGIEGNNEKVELARKHCPKGIFGLGDLEKVYLLEFGKKSKEGEVVKITYEMVIFSDVIYYLTPERQKTIMQEIHDVLENNGILLTSRHLGQGDHELNNYTHLFDRVKTEDVFNINTNSRWRITVWKKK